MSNSTIQKIKKDRFFPSWKNRVSHIRKVKRQTNAWQWSPTLTWDSLSLGLLLCTSGWALIMLPLSQDHFKALCLPQQPRVPAASQQSTLLQDTQSKLCFLMGGLYLLRPLPAFHQPHYWGWGRGGSSFYKALSNRYFGDSDKQFYCE